jgi:hypothetical protein
MVIKYMIHKIATVFTSIKPVGALIIMVISFLSPIASIVHGVLILIGLDLITGIMASVKKGKFKFNPFSAEFWRHITSNGLGKTIQKTLVYMILIITGFVIDTLVIPNATLMVTKVLSGAVGLRELKSLIENGEVILGGGIISYIRAVAKHGFVGALKQDDNE